MGQTISFGITVLCVASRCDYRKTSIKRRVPNNRRVSIKRRVSNKRPGLLCRVVRVPDIH